MDTNKAQDIMGKAAALFANKLASTPDALSYARSRGLDDETIAQFGIGFAPDSWNTFATNSNSANLDAMETLALIKKSEKGNYHYDFFRNRLMLPIKDINGHVVGFGGRALSADEKPKYLNTPETVLFKKSQLIFNLNEVVAANSKSIVITEGYMDVAKAHSVGFRNFGCVMGANFAKAHADAILNTGIEHVCFCFDGDRAGLDAAFKSVIEAAPLEAQGVRVMYSFCPEGMDPDDIMSNGGKPAMLKQLKSSIGICAVAGLSCIDADLFKSSKLDAVLNYISRATTLCAKTTLPLDTTLLQGAMNSPVFTDDHADILNALLTPQLKDAQNASLTRGV